MLIVPIWRSMVFVVVNGSVVRLDLHGDDVSLLLGDLVVLVGVLADHPVQAAVGQLGVAGAGEVHGEDLGGDGDITRFRTKAKLASRLK